MNSSSRPAPPACHTRPMTNSSTTLPRVSVYQVTTLGSRSVSQGLRNSPSSASRRRSTSRAELLRAAPVRSPSALEVELRHVKHRSTRVAKCGVPNPGLSLARSWPGCQAEESQQSLNPGSKEHLPLGQSAGKSGGETRSNEAAGVQGRVDVVSNVGLATHSPEGTG